MFATIALLRAGRGFRPAALVLAGATALTGCAGVAPPAKLTAPTQLDVYAPTIEAYEDRRAVFVLGQGDRLTPAAEQRALEAASAFRTLGEGPFTIAAPRGAETLARTIADLAYDSGVRREAILIASFEPRAGAPNEVSVSFQRYRALIKPCPPLSSVNLARSLGDVRNPTLGCAVNANIAAMAVNPADLLGPRPEGEPSADRRQAVVEAYKAGHPTQTPRGPGESVTISKAVN